MFHANADATEVVLNRIPQPVLARFVRIRPQAWKNGIALRFELYGCQITGKTNYISSSRVSQTFSGPSPHGTYSCENTILAFPKFTQRYTCFASGQRAGHSINNSIENIPGKKQANVLFFSLCLCDLMLNNSLICPSINLPMFLFILSSPFSHLSLFLSQAHNTPTPMCTHTLALALPYTYPPSLSPTHRPQTHTYTHAHKKHNQS